MNESVTVSTDVVTPGEPKLSLIERFRELMQDERIFGYTLLIPAMLIILIFLAYPFGLGVWMSLTDKLVGQPGKFIGLDNFRHMMKSEIFARSAWNTVMFTFAATVFKTGLGMWLALLLNRKFSFARFTRALILLPFIVPTVLSTLAWLWMFDATFSVFNWMMRWFWQLKIEFFGILLKSNYGYFQGPMWLGDASWAMTSIIIVNVWRGIPFFAISFLAGLQTVPPELYDAGEIDGASGWHRFWHITLPLIQPIAIVVIVFSIVVTFADFQLVYVLTRGGAA